MIYDKLIQLDFKRKRNQPILLFGMPEGNSVCPDKAETIRQYIRKHGIEIAKVTTNKHQTSQNIASMRRAPENESDVKKNSLIATVREDIVIMLFAYTCA